MRDESQARSPRFPVFLFDGDCAFCSSCARFIEKRIGGPADVVAWQHADLDALGVTQPEAEAAVQWVDGPDRHSAGPAAIAVLLRRGRVWWRPLGLVLGLRPVTALAWPVYQLVSDHRDKLPGGTAACAMPQAERDAAAA